MESSDTKRIVEINGIKIEVDLRTAKRIDQFRVGDGVKVLIKNYSSYNSHFGMIIGFDEFKSLPTIIIAYLESGSWSEMPLKFVYINEKTEGTEICLHDPKDLGVEKVDILTQFDRQVAKKEEEIRDLNRKRLYFVEMFGRFFENKVEATVS